MDIARMSMMLSQQNVQQQASISVTKMAMDNAKQQGNALQELMGTADSAAIQRAAQPHLGGKIDVKL